VLIADTAGRLQNKAHLMEELKKISHREDHATFCGAVELGQGDTGQADRFVEQLRLADGAPIPPAACRTKRT
jgi:signal recognition particle GTPase